MFNKLAMSLPEDKPPSGKISNEQFHFLVNYLSKKYGLRITPDKRTLLESRLISRLNALRIESIDAYLEFLFKSGNGQAEYEFFVDKITTHKTFFFRENHQFTFLSQILPSYIASTGVRTIKAWSAGCSTGEEVYTIGMVLNELRKEQQSFDFNITGTDVSLPSLRQAASGFFSTLESEHIPRNLKEKYFVLQQTNDGPALRFADNEITKRISLGILNLNRQVYNLPGNFDFIFCRNVIIYFDGDTRARVLERIVQKLKPGGYLFLGHSETALGTTLPLKSIKPTIYQRI